MARTAEVKQQSITKDTQSVESAADIHHMVMTLAATNSPDQLPTGAVTGDQANERIRTWLERGYRLHTVMPVQPGDVNGVFTLQMVYVLTKDDDPR